MIDFVGRRRVYAVVSLLMIIPSLIGLALWQFEAGLDFAGGLETEVRFLGDTDLEDVNGANRRDRRSPGRYPVLGERGRRRRVRRQR